MKNKKLFVILIAAVLCCAGYFAWDYFSGRGEKVTYAAFWKAVEAGDITDVKFNGDKIYFQGEASGKDLVTDNPHSPHPRK